jgi:hypothetical protein
MNLEHLQELSKNSPQKLLLGQPEKNNETNFPLLLQQPSKSGLKLLFLIMSR